MNDVVEAEQLVAGMSRAQKANAWSYVRSHRAEIDLQIANNEQDQD